MTAEDSSPMQDQSLLPDTIEALRRLSADSRLRPQERASVEEEMHEIEEFAAKLENGRVEIAAFGEVGSGKSALLNALAGEQIFAVSAEHGSTDRIAKTGFKNTKLVLVDTPGINEAAGELRGKLAEETVRYTDLVLFVADGDLNRVELDAFKQLSDLHKPIVLVINKADLHGPAQSEEISESILRKVGHRIGAADIVFAAAAPRESEREIHKADGTIEIVLPAKAEDRSFGSAHARSPRPRRQGDHRAQRQPVRVRRERPHQGIEAAGARQGSGAPHRLFHAGKALVVGANPVPVFDVLAGMATDALMVQRIGAIYGTDFSLKNAQSMVLEILRAWGLMAAAEYGLHLAADLLRTVTFGTSTVLTAVPQGLGRGLEHVCRRHHDRQAQSRRDRRARHRQGGGRLSRRSRRRGFGRGAAAGPWRDHGVHHACRTPRSSCSSRSARARRSPNSSSAIPTAACTTSATRSTTSAPPAMRSKRRARASSATASRRPARTASRCCSCTRRIFPAPWSSWNRADGCPSPRGCAIFFLIWWVVLFAVLPWGVRSQHEGGEVVPGTDPGAPAIPKLRLEAAVDDAGLGRGSLPPATSSM
jgi:GTP-binding protein Era